MKRLLPIALLFFGCISPEKIQVFESHALETGIAAAGGSVAILLGGPVGVAVFFVGMGTASIAGELKRPVADTTNTTTVLDKNGKILDQKTTHSTQGKTMDTHWYDFLPSNLVWRILIALAAFYVVRHPKVLRRFGAAIGVLEQWSSAAEGAVKGWAKSLRKPKAVPPPSMAQPPETPAQQPPAVPPQP